ncbi:response regulator transcription factor [Actinospica durhamensis]|uniref:Response regulator transcription factor n=1 Tax=Actinospica durhamensis TaxID=1508375 RepID=A0A941IUH3_9ACTN|nr:response regulator transcription factor [Actinospica durhamensis]MBR7839097.1 response regulator transcription factor [Actinospica durhamensis]
MSVLVDHAASMLAYRPAKLTAMVVVHDPRVRTSVTRHLWALGVRDVVEASTIAEARSRMATVRDIAVVDVHLPDGPGLALLAEMRTAGWNSAVAISTADDTNAVRAALASGVRGYVVTGARTLPQARPGLNGMNGPGGLGQMPPHLRERRLAAMSGQAGTMAALAQGSIPNTMNSGVRELSAREIEVLRLVADGRSNKAIGQTMGLSALTVKSHLARIARKLGTGDRAGMVAVAMRGGIIA